MKKYLLLIILFLTGCTKYNDLNELAIIKSIGISHNEEYTLFAEIIDEIDKDNNPITKVIETKDKDLNKLFNNIKLLVNKEIYFSHIDLLILDINLNNNDYQKIINYFLEHHEFRNDFLCVLSKDIKNVLENTKYDEIEDLITTNKESKNIIKISFEEIMKNYLDKQVFKLSEVSYNEKIVFNGNYKYQNNKLERITNEKK